MLSQVSLAYLGLPLAAVSLPSLPADPRGSATAVLALLAQLSAASANTSNAMSMAVSLDACSTSSDSLTRFSAYASLLWGAQAVWWEGVGKCAPIGSQEFELISTVNRRIAQWAEPLFLKAKNENIFHPSQPGSHNTVRYRVANVWSTSSLQLPPLQGIVASRPSEGQLIEAMDSELVAVHLLNSTAADAGRTHALLFISTALSAVRGGAPVRTLSVQMRADVSSTKPVEADHLQGWGDLPQLRSPMGIVPTFFGTEECFLSWYGGKMPLKLSGGSTQLVTYTRVALEHTRLTSVEAELRNKIGRSPLKRVS